MYLFCNFIGENILAYLYIVQTRNFHETFRFIDDLCALNYMVESQKPYNEIYSKELVLR